MSEQPVNPAHSSVMEWTQLTHHEFGKKGSFSKVIDISSLIICCLA